MIKCAILSTIQELVHEDAPPEHQETSGNFCSQGLPTIKQYVSKLQWRSCDSPKFARNWPGVRNVVPLLETLCISSLTKWSLTVEKVALLVLLVV
jgi:hypothetical protein